METQNITLRLPRELLRQVKKIAAERDTSVSSIMTESLSEMVAIDARYAVAKRQSMAAMNAARSLGTRGERNWTREDLHAR